MYEAQRVSFRVNTSFQIQAKQQSLCFTLTPVDVHLSFGIRKRANICTGSFWSHKILYVNSL